MNIVFFSVKDTAAKLRTLCDVASEHLHKGQSLLILVPDATVHVFVDELLWRLPEEGFLPHPSKLLWIDTEAKEATSLFNLRPIPFTEKISYKTIYELEDHTSPERLQLSRKRYAAYRELSLSISEL
ncbi:MAG: DNA polymerase III subunit chi [Verrucomicrobia bacterium]|nr:DNA polymerase III subunit chi [Verrucomicrobiota bacterium]